MYKLCVRQKFISQHALIGGDWGHENERHSHQFEIEVRLSACRLNQHGYVCDIVKVKEVLNDVLSQYRDRFLNDIPAFFGLNPSVENFSRILGFDIQSRLFSENFDHFEVRLWEDHDAWVSWIAPTP